MKTWFLHAGLYNPAFAQSEVRGHSTQVKIEAPLVERFVPHSDGWADRVIHQRLCNKNLYQKGGSDQGSGGTGILNIGGEEGEVQALKKKFDTSRATLKSMYSFFSCMIRTDYLESFTGKVKNTKHNDSWPCAHWDQRQKNRKGKEEGQ